MPVAWVEPDVVFLVYVSTAGPLDPPGSGQWFNLTDHAGVNYIDGDAGISIRRGRSDEFSQFQSGSCSFTLRNNNREFDPALAGVALDLPGAVGATATTPDHPSFAVGDLDVRARLSMDNWTPGGFGLFLVSQWPNVAGNNGWGLVVNATGNLHLIWTADGTTQLARTSTVAPGFVNGTVHWVRATLDVDNGAAGHDVRFYTSTDGSTWTQLGATVTTAGTTSVFNSTGAIALAEVLPMAGQVRYVEVRNGIDGPIVTNPDFAAQQPGIGSFVDSRDHTWTVNGAAAIGYDDLASVFAPILKPRRRVLVVTGRTTSLSTLTVLFSGFIDAWPQTWTKTTGSVEIVAHDLLSVLAQSSTSPALNVLVLDHSLFGELDRWPLAGALPVQLSGDRIRTLAGYAGLPSDFLDIAAGLTDLVALEPSGDVLGLCQEVAAAEAGFLYVDRGGLLVFLDRHSRFRDTRLASVQATFTDLQYSGMAVDYGLAEMWNDVRFTRPAVDDADMPVEYIVTNDATISGPGGFGRRVHSETIPVVSQAEVEARADFFLDRYSVPRQRPTPVTIKPRRDIDGLFLQVARRELLDRVELVRTPLGIGDPITFTGLIEQLEHRITNTEWDCTIGISPIDADEAQNYLILDDGALGQLDQEALAY